MEERQCGREYWHRTMAIVLAAVRADDRTQVRLELIPGEERADVALRHADGSLEAMRVQGADQPFLGTDIAALAAELLSREPDAAAYRLVLMGADGAATQGAAHADPAHPKLTIAFPEGGADAAEALLAQELGGLLHSHGIHADAAQLQFILGAISHRLTQFSTHAHFVSGRFFIRKLMEWVDHCCPDVLEAAGRAGLRVQFYHDGGFSAALPALRPGLVRSAVVRQRIARLRALCREIAAAPLPPHPSQPRSPADDAAAACCGLSAEAQSAVRRRAGALLRMELPEGFFRLGGLMRGFSASAPPEGSDAERARYETLLGLSHGLAQLEGLLRTFAALDGFRIVPLALCNADDRPYPQLTVQIELPKHVPLLTAESFPRPAPCVLRELTGDDGLLDRFLRQPADSAVAAYNAPWNPPGHFAYLYIGERRAEQEARDVCADFTAYLQSVFRFSVDDADPQRRVLEFKFDGLKPGQCVAFPCFLFVQPTHGFSIPCRILSPALKAPQRGRLEYGIRKP